MAMIIDASAILREFDRSLAIRHLPSSL